MEEGQLSSPHPSPEGGKEPDQQRKIGANDLPVSELPAVPPLRRLPHTYNEILSGGFRTVNIYPGSLNDPIVCDITEHELMIPDQYDALSYTWGNANDKEHIYPNGGYSYLAVTRNYFNAMRRLRDKYFRRRVWIDAVCINQDDIRERNRQVSIMGSIYKYSRKVFIYLGEDDLHSNVAMAYLQAIERREIQFHTRNTPQELEAVENFLTCPWFSRIWVLQEVYQAKEAIIICGNFQVSWAAVQSLRGFEYLREPRLKRWPYVTTVKDRKGLNSHLLHKLLAETRGCQATDPRDKLYALLPLLSDAKTSGLTANYAISRARCFYDVATFLAKTLDLRFLSDISSVQGVTHTDKMPTWVPDWATPLYRTPLSQIKSDLDWAAGSEKDTTVTRWRRACQEFQAWVAAPFLDINPQELPPMPHIMVPGISVDEIDTILSPANIKEKSWKEILCEWDEKAQNMPLKSICLSYIRSPLGDLIEGKDVRQLVSTPPRRPILQALFVELQHHSRSRTQNIVDSLQDFTYSDESLFGWAGERRGRDNDAWAARVEKVIHGRRFFRTKGGLFGLAGEEAQIGDTIAILATGPVPYVLRRSKCPHGWLEQKSNVWSFIGDCYVASAMTGTFTRDIIENDQEPGAPNVIQHFRLC